MPQLANHLHLPVQSGSDRILALMKRGYTTLRVQAAHPRSCARCGRTSRSPPTSSSAFPVRASAISRPRSSWWPTCSSISRSAFSTAAGPVRRRPRCRTRCRSQVKQQRLRSAAGAARCAGAGDQPPHGRQRAARAGRARRQEGPGRAGRPHREQPLGEFSRARSRCCSASSMSPSPRRARIRCAAGCSRGQIASRVSSASAASREFALEPADNARLASLCGPLDANLRLVESRLGRADSPPRPVLSRPGRARRGHRGGAARPVRADQAPAS